ncbi:NAD(P)/FAD-dependent oxidoreductase [Eubacteriaceae bacterium ES3]|nr:NAD(P)/FAD-dependent oxidoreductase [Eubacteriaceae bacterium ES3]
MNLYSHVFKPIRIRGIDFKNRIEMAPPSPNRADRDGRVSQEFIDWFKPIAAGGTAIIHVGNSVIDRVESSDEERQLDLGTDGCILPLSQFVEMCENFGCHASLEINHCGKDSDPSKIGRPALSASSFITPAEMGRAMAAGREPIATQEMSQEKIKETIEKYAMAAYRCQKAGMKICMIHGGHGNLISQFASKLYNKRSDEYGGSLENRARFCIEVLDAVREKVGENFVIEFRISADEIHPDGMHFEETIEFIELIKDKIDILHVSAGLHGEFEYMRNWWQNSMMDRMYNVHYAEDIKKRFPDLLVATVGSIMNIKDAEQIIADGKADFVAMCRPLIADPEMPKKFAQGREEDHRPCIRCQHCGKRLIMPRVIGCAVNPLCANIDEFPYGKIPAAPFKKKVGVIGSGPAGMQAVLTLCERGHDVTLYEKENELGGNLITAASPAFKIDMRDYQAYLLKQIEKSNATVLLNTPATSELLDKQNYDALIIAVGADPLMPDIPGIDKKHVYWAPRGEMGEVEIGEKTVIVGGGAIGIETAIELAQKGKDVTVIEMAKDLSDLFMTSSGTMQDLLEKVADLKIPILNSAKLISIDDASIEYEDLIAGETKVLPAQTVLMAVGMTPRINEVDTLRYSAPATEVFVVGDAVEVGTIAEAVNGAFKIAAHL